MAITAPYSGSTFVAYTDIAGFKAMMNNEKRLMQAMDALYSSGYRAMQVPAVPPIEGFFISDCGVLFARRTQETEIEALTSLLGVMEKIHLSVFKSAFTITTSIAFGSFTYRDKIEFEGLGKTAIHGDAYVSAFKDSEKTADKIYSNECRILKANLPSTITKEAIDTINIAHGCIRDENNYFYYEWMKRL